MNKSPGHERWPDHRVNEERVGYPMTVEINGETIARSEDVIRVKEDDHPDRYYFPRTDVRMDHLQRSTTTTECPFKGRAHYYSINSSGQNFKDAVWTYEEPYEEHKNLRDRLAFYDDKIPDIHVRAA